jgi:hypothetical protein
MPDSANISITLGGNPDRETIFRAVTEAYNPVFFFFFCCHCTSSGA